MKLGGMTKKNLLIKFSLVIKIYFYNRPNMNSLLTPSLPVVSIDLILSIFEYNLNGFFDFVNYQVKIVSSILN